MTEQKGAVLYLLAQTLDGFIADSDGGLDWLWHPTGATDIDEPSSEPPEDEPWWPAFFSTVGALAMGARTYEQILSERQQGEPWPYEGVTSWVFTSRDLPVYPGADTQLVDGPVEPVLNQMRESAGPKRVWIVGGGHLATQFADAGLIDELHVTVVATVLGEGVPTFAGRIRQRLTLTDAKPGRSYGNVELRYRLTATA